jgi:acyl-CoA reductase-like NAD-dependent aldehyde dehydrogenase
MSVLQVFSPWSGDVVGSVHVSTSEQVEDALSVSTAAHADGPVPLHARAAILDRAATLILDRGEELARTICSEAGKPITSARLEMERTVDTFRAAAVEARTLTGDIVPMDATASGEGRLAFTERVPAGVVLAITPFNFPLNLSAHKLAPAIAAGCPIIHKPASATPLTAKLLHEVLLEAGQPRERLHLVCGPGATVGDTLVLDHRVDLITFTGSSSVGWAIREKAPRKQVVLELGNSTPLIVRSDADLPRAAQAIVGGGFGYAGQSCISVQRVITHGEIHDELLRLVVERVGQLGVGDPADPSVVVGPLISKGAASKARKILSDSVAQGATLVVGDAQLAGPNGTLMEPVVLSGVTPDMPIANQELFGPGVAFMRSNDNSDGSLVRMANSSPYGLQASVWTSDVAQALVMARGMHFGGVAINESPTFRADQMPYGGIKDSGNAKEGPRWTVRSMTTERLVIVGARSIG